jgi:hypothetical protein
VVDKTTGSKSNLENGISSRYPLEPCFIRFLSALEYIPSPNSLQMMPRSREGIRDFKMSLTI